MTDRALQDLHPALYALYLKWEQACTAQNIRVGVSETWRSDAEQNMDFVAAKTNARAGESPHNCVDADGNPAARAFDFFICADDHSTKLDWDASDTKWQTAIKIGEQLGMVNGTQWHNNMKKDADHFELPHWETYDLPPNNSD